MAPIHHTTNSTYARKAIEVHDNISCRQVSKQCLAHIALVHTAASSNGVGHGTATPLAGQKIVVHGGAIRCSRCKARYSHSLSGKVSEHSMEERAHGVCTEIAGYHRHSEAPGRTSQTFGRSVGRASCPTLLTLQAAGFCSCLFSFKSVSGRNERKGKAIRACVGWNVESPFVFVSKANTHCSPSKSM